MKAAPLKLLLALQLYPGDLPQALMLARLIADIEKVRRRDIDFALVITREVQDEEADDFRYVIEPKLPFTVIRSKRFGKGWPAGPNDLWQDGMRQIDNANEFHKKGWTHILTFEPDCVPCRRDWINCLKSEVERMAREGKEVCGTVCEADNPARIHINGNAIFQAGITARYPALCGAGGPWDFAHRALLLKLGTDSNYIEQRYSDKEKHTAEFFEQISKNGERLAFIHGLKDPENIEIAREALKL